MNTNKKKFLRHVSKVRTQLIPASRSGTGHAHLLPTLLFISSLSNNNRILPLQVCSPNFLEIALASHARVACVALAMSRPFGSCDSARHPAYAYVDLVTERQADGQLPLVAKRVKGFKERRKLKG